LQIRLLNKFTAVAASKGDVIVKQGDVGVAFFVIQTGSVAVVDETHPESNSLLCKLYTGNFFGESW
jgi:ATP-binding cassette, subfamily B, bacterial HlyB/CyaB